MKRPTPPRVGQTEPTRPPITPEEAADIADLLIARQNAPRLARMSRLGRLRHWGGR